MTHSFIIKANFKPKMEKSNQTYYQVSQNLKSWPDEVSNYDTSLFVWGNFDGDRCQIFSDFRQSILNIFHEKFLQINIK